MYRQIQTITIYLLLTLSPNVLASHLTILAESSKTVPDLFDQLPGTDDVVLNLSHPPIVALGQNWQWECVVCTKLPELKRRVIKVRNRRHAIYESSWEIKKHYNWSSGRQVTGHDVKQAIRILIQKNPPLGSLIKSIQVDKKKPRKFKILFNRNQSNFYQLLAIRLGNLEKNNFNSYGPWQLISWKKESKNLVQNQNFKGTISPFKSIEVIPNNPSKKVNIDNLSYFISIGPKVTPFHDKGRIFGGTTYHTIISTTLESVILNLRNPIFDNKKLRRALHLSIDRNQYNDQAHSGNGLPYSFFTHPSDTSCPLLPQDPVDLDMAKQLVEKLEHNRKLKGIHPSTISLTLTYKADQTSVAKYIAAQWKAIGVKVTLNGIDTKTFDEKILKRVDFPDVALVSFRSIPGVLPYELLHSRSIPSYANSFRGHNISGWLNKEVDYILDSSERSSDEINGLDSCRGIQEQFENDRPFLPLVFSPIYMQHSNNLMGVVPVHHTYSTTLFSDGWNRTFLPWPDILQSGTKKNIHEL